MKKYDKIYDSSTDKFIFIDSSTGEVFDRVGESYYIVTPTEVVEQLKLKKKLQQRFATETDAPAYGDFAWHAYSMTAAGFPDLKDSYISRLMYLAARSTFDGTLMYENNRCITWDNLYTVLDISKKEAGRFKTAIIHGGYVSTRPDGSIMVNRESFFRGGLRTNTVAKAIQDDRYFVRMYFPAVRFLYESADRRSKGALNYIYKTLPFLHRDYNIVCTNPLEPDIEKVHPMRIGEFCDAIGYERSNASRMANILFKPTFIIDGKEQNAVAYVINRSFSRADYCMYVNPKVFYAGSKADAVKVLGAFYN